MQPSLAMLLKNNVENMSALGLTTILMKISMLILDIHDVNEKTSG
jgi:hypothetical protein